MKNAAMPTNSKGHLLEIIKNLAENKIDFIICGGIALVLHGIERMTLDLDISVSLKESNLKKLLKVLKKISLTPRVPVPPDIILDPNQRELLINEKNALVFTFIDISVPYRQVDIFLTNELSFESLVNFTEIIDINGDKVRLLSKEKLLELKESINPKRDKDLFDIDQLKKLIAGE